MAISPNYVAALPGVDPAAAISETTPRVLFLGEDWHGSNATSLKRAFRALGCDVFNIDEFDFYPQWKSNSLRLVRRLARRILSAEFSKYVERMAVQLNPQLIFVAKGSFLKYETLRAIQSPGRLVYNFYPDVNLVKHHKMYGNDFLRSAPLYDCVFTPKSYHIEVLRAAGVARVEFLPYAYDPWCHFPVMLGEDEQVEYASDVAFVGTWGQARSEILEALVKRDFPFRLAIWGNYWERVPPNSMLTRYVRRKAALGATQAKVFRGSKIALAFLSSPDLHTARTFEIPAYGAFMLAERTSEHVQFFREGIEAAYFADVDEMRNKISYYLRNEDTRNSIADAGYEKVTKGGHSYVDRVRLILRVYQEMARR